MSFNEQKLKNEMICLHGQYNRIKESRVEMAKRRWPGRGGSGKS